MLRMTLLALLSLRSTLEERTAVTSQVPKWSHVPCSCIGSKWLQGVSTELQLPSHLWSAQGNQIEDQLTHVWNPARHVWRGWPTIEHQAFLWPKTKGYSEWRLNLQRPHSIKECGIWCVHEWCCIHPIYCIYSSLCFFSVFMFERLHRKNFGKSVSWKTLRMVAKHVQWVI